MSTEFDAAYAKAIGALNTLHRAAIAAEAAEEETKRLRTQNDAIVAALRERGYKGVDLAADVVALFAYCDGLSSQLADRMDRANTVPRCESVRDVNGRTERCLGGAGHRSGCFGGVPPPPPATPDIVRAFKGGWGEWRTHPYGQSVTGSRTVYPDGEAREFIDNNGLLQVVPIDLHDDEARRKWVEAAPCWDLPTHGTFGPRTERVTVEGVGLADKKQIHPNG